MFFSCLLMVFLQASGIALAATLPDSEIQALNAYPNWVSSDCATSSNSSGSGVPVPTTGSLENKNAAIIWNYFTGKGLSAEQTAGFLGNWQSETMSTFDPSIVVGGGHSNSVPGPNMAYGLAQWMGGRQANLHAFAQKKGTQDSDLNTQLDFAWSELQGSYKSTVYDPLIKTKTVAAATWTILVYYESPGNYASNQTIRLNYANNWYGKFNGYTGSGTTGSSCSVVATTMGGAGPNGWDRTGPNAMIYYAQCDPKWASKPYGNGGSICDTGCGLTSMTMVIATLTNDPSITPDKMAIKYGSYHVSLGTNHALFPQAASDYGFKYENLGSNFNGVRDILKKGGLVIIGVNAGYFTTGGHLMVIRAMTSDQSEFYIADPADPNREGPYTPAFLTGTGSHEGNMGGLWGFYK